MLSYFELKNYIYNCLDTVQLPHSLFDRIWFEYKYDVTDTDATLWYYEPGRNSINVVCRSKEPKDIIYATLKAILEEYSFEYELKNRVYGQDSRKIAFNKQLEWFNKIDNAFYEKRQEEINGILSNNPFR